MRTVTVRAARLVMTTPTRELPHEPLPPESPALQLAGVRDRFLVGCENCTSRIIPDALIKNKVQRAAAHQPNGPQAV
jgi:hypothetical protein